MEKLTVAAVLGTLKQAKIPFSCLSIGRQHNSGRRGLHHDDLSWLLGVVGLGIYWLSHG